MTGPLVRVRVARNTQSPFGFCQASSKGVRLRGVGCGGLGSARQQGAAALILAVMVALATGTIVAVTHLNRVSERASDAVDEGRRAANWATEALTGYMVARGRLPCVARTVGGAEDCKAGEKGYLPVGELEQVNPGSTTRFGRIPMVYVYYRGTGTPSDPDFSKISEVFSPLRFDGSPVTGYTSQLSTFDLCGKLRAMSVGLNTREEDMGGRAAIPARADRAHLTTGAGGSSAVSGGIVFGVSVQGADFSSSVVGDFAQPALPDPAAATTSDASTRTPTSYADARTLFLRLHCGAALTSANLMASAQDLTRFAAGQRTSNSEVATNAVISQHGFVLSSLAAATNGGIDLASGIELIAKNAANIAANPFLTPLYVWGMSEGAVATGLAAIDIARFLAGAAVDEAYWLAYVAAAERAKGQTSWQGGPAALGQIDHAGLGNEP